ncbi:MAG: hypothetical protein DSZ08_00400 [Sulfurovum sp.]|nr:MAG: hypothetical protein DSZ08_00400 [Sulfurovum sp.]
MKKILTTAGLFLTIQLQAGNVVPSDKFSHVYAGLGIYAGCFLIKGVGEALHFNMDYLNAKTCVIPVIAAGVGKEVYDSQHTQTHTPEILDAVSTIALPLAIGFSIDF